MPSGDAGEAEADGEAPQDAGIDAAGEKAKPALAVAPSTAQTAKMRLAGKRSPAR